MCKVPTGLHDCKCSENVTLFLPFLVSSVKFVVKEQYFKDDNLSMSLYGHRQEEIIAGLERNRRVGPKNGKSAECFLF